MMTLEEFCNQRGIPVPTDPDEESALRVVMAIYNFAESYMAFCKKILKLTLKLAFYLIVGFLIYLGLHIVEPLLNGLHRLLFQLLFVTHLGLLNSFVTWMATFTEMIRHQQIASAGKQLLSKSELH